VSRHIARASSLTVKSKSIAPNAQAEVAERPERDVRGGDMAETGSQRADFEPGRLVEPSKAGGEYQPQPLSTQIELLPFDLPDLN
jgi:hypothetical protein